MKCRLCDKKFNEKKAMEKFNDYFNGRHDYYYEGWEGICADCAIWDQEDMDERGENDDDPPAGCRECGGDYPNCVDSCPFYDD